MEKLMMFQAGNISNIACAVNDWIEKEKPEITRVLQSISDTGDETAIIISIFYKTDN